MRRILVLGAALLLAACGHAGPVQCGACEGPVAIASHFPRLTHEYLLSECVGSACTSPRPTPRPHRRSVYGVHLGIETPAGLEPQDLDGRTITYTVTSDGRVWIGSGVLHYVDEPGPCGCDGLRAGVDFTRRG